MEKIIIDARGAIFGRMASYVSRELLKGKSVDIFNCGEIIISGSKNVVVEKINAKRRMGSGGSMKGPKYILQEDLLIKRMIRGMLPWDRPRGRDAYRRLRCYVGDVEEKSKENKVVTFEHKKPLKYSTIKKIVVALK